MVWSSNTIVIISIFFSFNGHAEVRDELPV